MSYLLYRGYKEPETRCLEILPKSKLLAIFQKYDFLLMEITGFIPNISTII